MVSLYGDVKSNYTGFNKIVELNYSMNNNPGEADELDMGRLSWLDANMCAPLGAVLKLKRKKSGNKTTGKGIPPGIEAILKRNHFLERSKLPDGYDTTIEYRHFQINDSKKFSEYVAKHFAKDRKPIPKMSPQLSRKFRESISEIFENSREHSESELGIFACGQYYPQKEQLDFSIADLGIGIQENIRRSLKLELDAVESLVWAMTEGSTTRTIAKGKPGGLGLKLIKQFINLNKGRLILVSGKGFWSYQNSNIEKKAFDYPFPGTVVNIEINTADTSSYRLTSEIDPGSVF